jgi:hypothetical protein
MLGVPARVDPEVAAATFAEHLDTYWRSGRPDELGITRRTVDALHELIGFTAVRPDGARDPYFVILGAEFYDMWPTTVAFVDPAELKPAPAGSQWWPRLRQNPPWLGLHNTYQFRADGGSAQMVCFSFTAEYYRSEHTATADIVWRQGYHTVAATIAHIAEFLQQPYYEAPSA